MVKTKARTADTRPLPEGAVEKLRPALRGHVLQPGDDTYDTIRQVWNAMIDRRPALIVRCAGVSDVMRAVAFAREHDMLASVRGGGHNVAGNAVCDGGMMIDLSLMRGVQVDPSAHTARAQGGVTWGDLDTECQAHGLATTGGVVSTTGIGGLTLGGGIGWLMRSHGLTCDNLLAVDMVTADGGSVRANAQHNRELFWGVRGGGGNFGVVTTFEYRVHHVGPVYAGSLVYPAGKAEQAMQLYRDFIPSAPDELDCELILTSDQRRRPVVRLMLCYLGPKERGAKLIKPLRAFGPPVSDDVRTISYGTLQHMLDDLPGVRRSHYYKSNFMEKMTDAAIDVMLGRMAEPGVTTPLINFECFAGAVTKVREDETVFSHRKPSFNFTVESSWDGARGSDADIAWVRGTWEAMKPFLASGVYVNYMTDDKDEGQERVKAAFGAAKYERLVALKTQYDPTNFFRLNQNIKPRTQGA
ncbi:MAG: FAD-binding oxidoreductase [SAR202 cluster bacterium]|nr:FAD-binding oxidoreductase [SAR202 cluster bacterium]